MNLILKGWGQGPYQSTPPVATPRSSSVPIDRVNRWNSIDRLAHDKETNLEVVNSIKNVAHVKKHVSIEIDTDQGEGITKKLKFVAKHLNDKIQFHTSGTSDECSELTTTPEHDQPLVNQSDVFSASPKATTSSQQGSQRKYPALYPKT